MWTASAYDLGHDLIFPWPTPYILRVECHKNLRSKKMLLVTGKFILKTKAFFMILVIFKAIEVSHSLNFENRHFL